jgi:hypothetical protein
MKRPFGRLRYGQKNNVKINLKVMRYEDVIWIQLFRMKFNGRLLCKH